MYTGAASAARAVDDAASDDQVSDYLQPKSTAAGTVYLRSKWESKLNQEATKVHKVDEQINEALAWDGPPMVVSPWDRAINGVALH